jgi:hypothetical protein
MSKTNVWMRKVVIILSELNRVFEMVVVFGKISIMTF